MTIIEYLINEIDCLTPVEQIYEEYCDKLYKISNLNFNLTYTSFKTKIYNENNINGKKYILTFRRDEGFVVSIDLVQRVLKRTLTVEEFDL